MFQTKQVTIDQLLLDELNPRFTTRDEENFTQEEIINYLLEYEELFDLLKKINNYGGFTPGERLIVVEENDKYIVLEGNRRTASLKLLQNPKLTSRITVVPQISKTCSEFINSIPVDVVSSREEADRALLNRHIDGIRLWSQFSKMKFYKKMFDNGRTLEEISSMSDDSPLVIRRTLHRYSILRNILDNYLVILPNSTYLSETVDAQLDTELILRRMYSYYTDKSGLNLSFAEEDHTLILPKDSEKKSQLLKVLVLIAKMHWEDKLIDTRELNTVANIYKFFDTKSIDNSKKILNETHMELLKTLKQYQSKSNYSSDNETGDETDSATDQGADNGTKNATGQGTDNGTENTTDQGTDNGTEYTTNPYELYLGLKTYKKRVIMYNDFNLIELIAKASDSTNKDLTTKVTFNMEESNLINDSIFSGDATEGVYHIQVKLEHGGKSISKGVTIEVYIPKSKINIIKPNNNLFTSVTAFALEEVEIDINYTVNTLINEIQSLKAPEDSKLMIASSIRQLIELSVTKIISDKKLTNRGNPKNNLIFLIDEKFSNKALFTKICNGDNKIKYEATKNLIGSINASQLWDYLNLITHDSYSSIYSDLVEKVNKQITPLLVVFHNYLKLEGS